ncbi:MAG: ribosome biogenesis factor YjgA [Halioglobus sp.]
MHNEKNHSDDLEAEWEGPSKSAVKREMNALQKLGEELTSLSPKQLAAMPIEDDKLLAAIEETRRISSNNAMRRHRQYIGKLMRGIDPEPIAKALASLHAAHSQRNEEFHALESLRDQLLTGGDSAISTVLERWPSADRQHLRQLVRQHKREQSQNKPPAASRKIFRYLRDLFDAESD